MHYTGAILACGLFALAPALMPRVATAQLVPPGFDATAKATPLSSDRDMVTGVSVTEADCRALTGRLWVRVENRGFCVRFWLSTAGGSRDEALVAFHGDIGAMIDGKLQLSKAAKPTSDGKLQNAADYGSRLYWGPYIWIARPGAFGSSGHHVKDRRTLLEIRIAMAALDALKRHHGFKRFHLVGQSGGGHTVAGLVQLRSDIGCAVITSGATSLRSAHRDRGHPIVGKHRFYDPIDHVHAMKQRPGLRLFVVSDRNDKKVSYRSQLEFVERVKKHNLPITHVTTTATDKDSHDLFAHGHRLAVECANKARDQVAVASENLKPPGAVSGALAPPYLNFLQPAPPASQSKFSDRVGQLPAQSDTAQPANSPGSGPVAAVAQRVVLYEEDPADPQGKRYVGRAIWRTETVTLSPGAAPDLVVRADLEIPERRITMTFSLRRNSDQALSASHTIEVRFNLPAEFPFGGISNVPGILMKQAEQTRGAPLAGLAVKVTSGFFRVGLSAVKADMQRNLQLLKERAWFDIPIVYNNGRRAILALEKGNPGERAVEEAFKAWEQTSADLAPPGGEVKAQPQPAPLISSPIEMAPKRVKTIPIFREDRLVPWEPTPAPRQAKPRGATGRCFVLGGRSFCE
jgi:dienelactone hydrolase